MSPTGPNYAGTAADTGTTSLGVSGTAWSTPANATGQEDATYATATMSGRSNGLKLTNFGFNLPATAIIDGIYVEFDRAATGTVTTDAIALVKAGAVVAASQKSGTDTWPGSEAFTGYGGSSDLWGARWTYSDINNSGFGVVVYAVSGAAATAKIDAVRVTVSWHTAPTSVPKRYLYQVFTSSSVYLGNLPNVLSDFSFAQEMNTAGAQISIEVGVSADTAAQPVDTLTDESGSTLTDESGNALTTEGQVPVVALGSASNNALIKNGNRVKVYEYSYWHPNGQQVFSGEMENWAADFGGSGEDKISILCYSDGSDLQDYLVRGNPYTYTTDQSQVNHGSSGSLSASSDVGSKFSYSYYGQTFVVGPGVTTIGAIALMLNGSATVAVTLYDSPAMATVLGTTSQYVNVTSATEIQFAFPTPLSVSAGTSYFVAVRVNGGQSLTISYTTGNQYTSGDMYTASSSGTGSFTVVSGSDLYFKTASGTGATTGTYTSQDPATGMMAPILDDYRQRGGLVSYTASSIQSTSLSLTYGFNTQTILEAVQSIKSMCPNGYYWYVDIGSDVLTLKQTNTGADFTIIKGQNTQSIKIVASIESITNTSFFSGGLVGGSNLYTAYSDATSMALYGPRLNRLSDQRVTDLTTGQQIAKADVLTNKAEQFQTSVTLLDSQYFDISTIKPGMVVGFAGFGTFVDSLLMQVVRLEKYPEYVTLTLGVLPKRLHPAFDKLTRGLVALQTVNNPTTPS